MAELGIEGYETYNWFGILARSGTPAEIIERLNREIVAVVNEPETQEWLRSRGAVGKTGTVADFSAYIAADLAKWTKLVKMVGITPE